MQLPSWARLPDGWRRLAILNVAVISVTLLIMASFLLAAYVASTDFMQVWIFYSSRCTDISAPNILIHLLLNAFSTVVLASSNFFMQICNAPSRQEIDAAHAKQDWLDIGVPSLRNAFRLSWFKLIAWAVLFLTSIPIHMVFNSSVLLLNDLTEGYNLTVATPEYIEGAAYAPAGFITGLPMTTPLNISHQHFPLGLGKSSLASKAGSQSNSDSTFHAQDLASTAVKAKKRKRLEPSACVEMYTAGNCSGLNDYRDVVMIVNNSGWSEPIKAGGSFIPLEETPVFTAGYCWIKKVKRKERFAGWENSIPTCEVSCSSLITPKDLEDSRWVFNITGRSQLGGLNRFRSSSLDPGSGNSSDSLYDVYLPNFRRAVKLSYCMAELRLCSLAVSKPLFLVLTISIASKLFVCVMVIWKLGSQESLVTPGDVIASFLSSPDDSLDIHGPITQMQLRKSRRRGGHQSLSNRFALPAVWSSRRQIRSIAVPKSVWVVTYCVIIFGGFACFMVFTCAPTSSLQLFTSEAGEGSSLLSPVPSGSPFISSLIAVNTPQLYLSLFYLLYNSLITRLEMSREWALFSVQFSPLRVTRPKGQQIGTYRLQLPYKYSLTLIALGTLMHWLISNTLFIIVNQGDYEQSREGYWNDRVSMPADATFMIGAAPVLPLLVIFIVGSIMSLFARLRAQSFLPGYMPIVGSNSLAMAAACEVSPLVKVPGFSRQDHGDIKEMELLEFEFGSNIPAETDRFMLSDSRENLAFRLLKWGEVPMTDEWHRRVVADNESLTTEDTGHLGFGTILDDPKPPTEGRYYI